MQESDTNYSTVEVTWQPLDNNSRVDFYHYQIIADMEGTTHILYDVNTTNTSTILYDLLRDSNISFVLFANNCEGL